MMNSATEVRTQIAALLPRLRRFGRTLAHSREDADDLVQMAIEKALVRTDQWTPGTRLDSWMFRIMQTTWIDELRSRERRGQTFFDEAEGAHVGVSSNDAQVDAMSVRKAVSQLGDDQRAVDQIVQESGAVVSAMCTFTAAGC